MSLVTWNINSIRARLNLVLDFVDAEQPDVLCFQETKCTDAKFPRAPFADRGYEIATHGSGPQGGVAILSRVGLTNVAKGFGGQHRGPFNEPRFLAADVGDLRLVTLYAPNGKRVGQPEWKVKLAWFELLAVELELELEDSPRLVVAGDFNVCPAPIDVYDFAKKHKSNLVTAEERAAVAKLLDKGFTDIARTLHPEDPGYSWYSYSAGQFGKGKGYRLDLVLAGADVADDFTSCRALRKWREPSLSPSDHCPVIAVRSSKTKRKQPL